jgi:hypothetical protein
VVPKGRQETQHCSLHTMKTDGVCGYLSAASRHGVGTTLVGSPSLSFGLLFHGGCVFISGPFLLCFFGNCFLNLPKVTRADFRNRTEALLGNK